MKKKVKNFIKNNISSRLFSDISIKYSSTEKSKINWHSVLKHHVDIAKKNLEIIKEREIKRKTLKGIQVGDYLIRKNGKISRVTYLLGDQIQDGGGNIGSFYLLSHGGSSYSGTLDFPIKKNKIVLTNKKKPAWFWIFSENLSGTDRAIYFQIKVNIWKEI